MCKKINYSVLLIYILDYLIEYSSDYCVSKSNIVRDVNYDYGIVFPRITMEKYVDVLYSLRDVIYKIFKISIEKTTPKRGKYYVTRDLTSANASNVICSIEKNALKECATVPSVIDFMKDLLSDSDYELLLQKLEETKSSRSKMSLKYDLFLSAFKGEIERKNVICIYYLNENKEEAILKGYVEEVIRKNNDVYIKFLDIDKNEGVCFSLFNVKCIKILLDSNKN